jgi:hypothetical protein
MAIPQLSIASRDPFALEGARAARSWRFVGPAVLGMLAAAAGSLSGCLGGCDETTKYTAYDENVSGTIVAPKALGLATKLTRYEGPCPSADVRSGLGGGDGAATCVDGYPCDLMLCLCTETFPKPSSLGIGVVLVDVHKGDGFDFPTASSSVKTFVPTLYDRDGAISTLDVVSGRIDVVSVEKELTVDFHWDLADANGDTISISKGSYDVTTHIAQGCD